MKSIELMCLCLGNVFSACFCVQSVAAEAEGESVHPQTKQCLVQESMWSTLSCVCLHTQYTKNTPRTACHLTNQRAAGTQGSGSVKVGEGRRMQWFWWSHAPAEMSVVAVIVLQCFVWWAVHRLSCTSKCFYPFFLPLLSFSILQFRSHHITFRLSVTEVQVA